MNRRFFLGTAAKATVAVPLAGRAMAEQTADKLIGANTTGLGYNYIGVPDPNALSLTAEAKAARESRWLSVLADNTLRPELESLLYDQLRQVSHLDPDLANKQSFSLAAKITFQRQRNVKREIEQRKAGWPFQRIEKLMDRFIGLFP